MVSVADIARTLERRRNQGGKLGENPVALELVSEETLQDVLDNTPAMPRTVAETGIARGNLLNRWIIPLESRIDYLKLKTGKSFSIPFDELVIFLTNLAPADLMDPAFLRRKPYKIHKTGPRCDEYREAFNRVAQARGLSISDEVFDLIVQRITSGAKQDLAYFQPRFICDQVKQVCRCFNLPTVITKALAEDALANLYVEKD